MTLGSFSSFLFVNIFSLSGLRRSLILFSKKFFLGLDGIIFSKEGFVCFLKYAIFFEYWICNICLLL